MWKVLSSETPIGEDRLDEMTSQGWELRLCVPAEGIYYWYFFQELAS